MKTERFDGEFRRKMLGLPAETDAGDVDRILGYVSANRPGKPGIGWGKALLYGSAGALLTGSLLYNINQYHTNKYLYSSLDSLKQQYESSPLQHHSLTQKGSVNQPDTVFITRYRDRFLVGTQRQPEPAGTLGRPDGFADRLSAKPVFEGAGKYANRTRANRPMPSGSEVGVSPVEETAKGESAAGKQLKWAPDSVLTDPNQPLATPVDDRKSRNFANLERPLSDSGQKEGSTRLSTRQRLGDPLVPTEPLAKQPGRMEPSTNGFFTVSRNSVPDQAMEPSGAAALKADFLQPRQVPSYALSRSLVRSVEAIPVTLGLVPKHRPHWGFPKVAVAGASLWAGVGASVGHKQLGSSLLGEWRLNSHWSIQTGVQLTFQGDHFFSDDDFQRRTRQDFRTLYAPSIPYTYELLDISQSYQLLQLPFTVAYHYPLGHDWSLRFGVGTNVNLYAQNRVTFDYSENSRSFDHGFYRASVPVAVINTLLVSAGMDRQWKGWLFRVSPFIGPQLKPIVQDHEKLFWGVQAGILHQFGGH